MRIKLDENLSRHLKPLFTSLGHDVETTADEGLLGQPDTKVGERAKQEGRMLLTLAGKRSSDLIHYRKTRR